MLRRIGSGIMVTLMLIGIFTLTINIQQVDASEPPATEWTRTYGGANYDSAFSVVETSDGGYAIAGFTTSFGAGSYDFWLIKTDNDGNTQWNQTYGGVSHDFGESVVETSDGGYAIAGRTYSFDVGGGDFWLVKVAGPPAIPVGGIWVPVDKFALLAPIFGSTFTIIVGTVAAAIYVKRRKKQQN